MDLTIECMDKRTDSWLESRTNGVRKVLNIDKQVMNVCFCLGMLIACERNSRRGEVAQMEQLVQQLGLRQTDPRLHLPMSHSNAPKVTN